MIIHFKSSREKAFYESEKELVKEYGYERAKKIQTRIKQMRAFSSVGELFDSRLGRGHLLSGNYNKCFSLDLDGPYRLIVKLIYDENTNFSKLDLYQIDHVEVMEVANTHGE